MLDAFLNRILADPLVDLSTRHLLELAMGQFYAFTLVLVRMSGLMTIGPLFGQSIVPANVRILLAGDRAEPPHVLGCLVRRAQECGVPRGH